MIAMIDMEMGNLRSVLEACERAVRHFEDLGCEIVEASPDLGRPDDIWWKLWTSSNAAAHGDDLDQVRDAMREHDRDAELSAPPRMSHGPSEMRGGVEVIALDLEGPERFQLLRRELGVSAFGINLLRFRPRQRGRIHCHRRQEEAYLVLEGTLTLDVEGEPRELPKGSIARVAADVRRRLSNRGDELLAVLAVGGALAALLDRARHGARGARSRAGPRGRAW